MLYIRYEFSAMMDCSVDCPQQLLLQNSWLIQIECPPGGQAICSSFPHDIVQSIAALTRMSHISPSVFYNLSWMNCTIIFGLSSRPCCQLRSASPSAPSQRQGPRHDNSYSSVRLSVQDTPAIPAFLGPLHARKFGRYLQVLFVMEDVHFRWKRLLL